MENKIYSTKYVKELFNKMSSSYERMNYLTSFGFSIRWRRQFLKPFTPSPANVEVLDLLTGMGETWSHIHKIFPKANLTVIDFSEGMLSHAKQKNKNKYNNRVTLIHQDVLCSDLQSDHYDYITCAFGLKTFDEDQLLILASETKRVLKKGGQFSFIEVSKPSHKILYYLYGFYLGRVVPVLGKLLLGDPEQYRMLWLYTENFKNAIRAREIFANAGLSVQYRQYFYGCATGFYGQKNNV